MASTAAEAVRQGEAVGRFTTVARTNMRGVALTGIDGTTLQGLEPEAWRILNGYLHSPSARYTNSGTIDYDLRQRVNPLQPYLDRLQRRTR